MHIAHLFGIIILSFWLIWTTYFLLYWNNLAWRFPEKFRTVAIDNARRLPKWLPFGKAALKSADRQSARPARLLLIFVDAIFAVVLFITIYAISLTIISEIR
jgi:hypothetical protein